MSLSRGRGAVQQATDEPQVCHDAATHATSRQFACSNAWLAAPLYGGAAPRSKEKPRDWRGNLILPGERIDDLF